VLLVIEDNGYAISVRKHLQTPGGNIADNLASFRGLTIWQGDGTTPAETAGLVAGAVEHVRQGRGPGLLRLEVPRLSGHTGIDNQAYKTEDEIAEEWSRDPLPRIREYLLEADMLTADGWDALVEEVQADVRRAAEEAEAMPQPDPAQAHTFTFADPSEPPQHGGLAAEGVTLPEGTPEPHAENPSRINMIEAVRLTLASELTTNPRLLVFGEDVGVKGGVHAATLGLINEFGEERVFDTSLSEEGIVGRAMGMAYAGLTPCPEIQFRKYADTATEAINNTGTIRWRTANTFAAPMVIRVPGGFRKIGDPWHSVTSEVQYAHAVGWKVAFPSNAEDAVGLLRAALRGSDPVIFFEHRAVLDASWARRPYPGDDYVLPFGKAKHITTGDDLTVVTWGALVHRVQQAAKGLDASVEIIDLRTIVPWDQDAVLESVKKTSRCLIVHEDIGMAGFGAEVASVLVDEVFFYLDAPIRRVTAPKVPVPFNTTLMDAVVPTEERIRVQMQDLLSI
jgi:2-oxoisovalerate dehydrogenase E1 component